MKMLLVIGVYDGWTQALLASRSGVRLKVHEHRFLDNALGESLARHGVFRKQALELLARQLRGLMADFHNRADESCCVIGSALGEGLLPDSSSPGELRSLVGGVISDTLCLTPFEEARLLLGARQARKASIEGVYLVQPGAHATLLVADLGRQLHCRLLPLGSERPGVMNDEAVLDEPAEAALKQVLRGHLKELLLCGHPAWLLGAQLRRMAYMDTEMLEEREWAPEDLAAFEERLLELDGEQRGMLPLLKGKGHMLRDTLAIVRTLLEGRGFQQLRFLPWNAVHGLALERLVG